MWPRDAYVGQRVVGLQTCYIRGDVTLEKGKVYTIESIVAHPVRTDIPYFYFVGSGDIATRYDLVKPVDETRLDVFREMLQVAKDKIMDGQDA